MKPLLLLHGALGTAKQLEPLAHHFAVGRDVHTLNFYGHGGDSAPEGGYSFTRFAEDILTYLDANGLEQIDIFGYSMGGYAAMFFALKYPARVGKIATLGTKVNWTVAGSQQEVKMLDADKLEAKVPAFAEQLKQLHGADNWRGVLAATAKMMLNLGENPVLTDADYQALQNPVLLGIGDRDHTAGLEDTVATYRLLPQAQLWVLPATPHPLDKVNTTVLTDGLKRFFG